MNHSILRLCVVCLLTVFFAAIASGHHNPGLSIKATEKGKLVADGPGPVPWPKSVQKTMAEKPTLLADGGEPVPWPKRATEPANMKSKSQPTRPIQMKPMLRADGPGPVPWPKAKETTGTTLMADGPGPVPWPKGATTQA